MPPLADWWFGHITSYGQELDDWAEMAFLLWGQHELPSIAEEQLDGEVEYLLEDAFAEITALLPRPTAESQLSFLQAKLRRLQREHREPRVPHRPAKSGSANAAERLQTGQANMFLMPMKSRRFGWEACEMRDGCNFQPRQGFQSLSMRRAANRFWLHICFLAVHDMEIFIFIYMNGLVDMELEYITMLSLDAAVSVHYGKFRSLDLSPAAVCGSMGCLHTAGNAF